jgi:hypothetical protein
MGFGSPFYLFVTFRGSSFDLLQSIGILVTAGLGIGLCMSTLLVASQNAVDHKYIATITTRQAFV